MTKDESVKFFNTAAMNRERQIADHVRAILELLGVAPDHPLLEKTPERVAHLYLHSLFDGLDPKRAPQVKPYLEPATHHEEVILEAIPFVSMCEHHLVPMIGIVRIAYMPSQYVIGFSHFYDIVRYFAHRPQLQERLTREIADYLCTLLQTEDVSVTIKATHFCVLSRSESELTSTVETRVARGLYSPLMVSSRTT